MPGSDPPRRGGRSSFEASKRETLPKNRLFRGARKCHRRRVSADDSLPVTLLKSVIGLGESDHQRRDVWTNHRADLPNIHWRVSSKESQSATGRTAQKLIAFERLTRGIPEHNPRAAQAARQESCPLIEQRACD
jgi:hypothetical protein